ncbi:unnamed protein product [Menidia menidia]|uniref:(Atlantic silverside) hypothetical protein n=1 Tax=Menidia menidia TaxID=238744 RepID=A0A8S4ATB6_9TELE|nr:unnamed protein product [Menidia menidia]
MTGAEKAAGDGPQISCFTPTNFTAKQAGYVDTYCWDSLMHHEFDGDGNFEERSLWVHKRERSSKFPSPSNSWCMRESQQYVSTYPACLAVKFVGVKQLI